jgi:division/cell wall cluster transcriptional repressor MraZ
MFRGLQTGRVDDKYRLKFPAFVQKKLSDTYGSGDVFITSLDGKEIKIYPLSEWERVERTLAEKSSDGNSEDGKRKNKFLFLANHYGAEQSLDNQGRILIPVPLREGSGVGCEIKMVWQANHLLALNEENYAQKMTQHGLSEDERSYAANLGF